MTRVPNWLVLVLVILVVGLPHTAEARGGPPAHAVAHGLARDADPVVPASPTAEEPAATPPAPPIATGAAPAGAVLEADTPALASRDASTLATPRAPPPPRAIERAIASTVPPSGAAPLVVVPAAPRASESPAPVVAAQSAAVGAAGSGTLLVVGVGTVLAVGAGVALARVGLPRRVPEPAAAPASNVGRLVPDLLRAGQAAVAAGAFDDAIRLFRAALAQAPALSVARVCEGMCLDALGRYDEAYATLQLAFEQDSADGLARLQYARACARTARAAEAMATLAPLLHAWPEGCDTIADDDAFANLRDHPRFLQMVGRL